MKKHPSHNGFFSFTCAMGILRSSGNIEWLETGENWVESITVSLAAWFQPYSGVIKTAINFNSCHSSPSSHIQLQLFDGVSVVKQWICTISPLKCCTPVHRDLFQSSAIPSHDDSQHGHVCFSCHRKLEAINIISKLNYSLRCILETFLLFWQAIVLFSLFYSNRTSIPQPNCMYISKLICLTKLCNLLTKQMSENTSIFL